MLRCAAAIFAAILFTPAALAQTTPTDRAGDTYEIRVENLHESAGDGSSGRSTDVSTLVERVITVREDGVVLEFDLPAGATAAERAQTWQFPVRVLRTPDGVLHLLNAAELEARIATWLRRAGVTEADCGRWVFTWTAFKIECDAQTVLNDIAPFDLRLADLRDGGLYQTAHTLAPAPLREERGARGSVFTTQLQIDPEAVRSQRAQSDVIVASIAGPEPLSLEAAQQRHASDQISGTIVVTIETDSAGRVMRRTQVTRLEITDARGATERQTNTETAERRQPRRRAARR